MSVPSVCSVGCSSDVVIDGWDFETGDDVDVGCGLSAAESCCQYYLHENSYIVHTTFLRATKCMKLHVLA